MSVASLCDNPVQMKRPERIVFAFLLATGVEIRPIGLEMPLFTEEEIELQTSCCEQSCLGRMMVERYSPLEITATRAQKHLGFGKLCDLF